MSEPPAGAPPFKGHRAAYRELLKSLWYAAGTFKDKADGGHEGAKLACHAVIRFLGVRHENPELAAPFLAIHQAFADVQGDVDPELFSRSTEARERSRSRQRKHAQLFASVCMEVLMKCGDKEKKEAAANTVARYAAKWPSLRDANVTSVTVGNWRHKIMSSSDPRRAQFDQICAHFKSRSDPRREVKMWLKKGPPGTPSSYI